MDFLMFGKAALTGGIWLMTSITIYYMKTNKTNDTRSNIKIRNCRRQIRNIRRFKENDKSSIF